MVTIGPYIHNFYIHQPLHIYPMNQSALYTAYKDIQPLHKAYIHSIPLNAFYKLILDVKEPFYGLW